MASSARTESGRAVMPRSWHGPAGGFERINAYAYFAWLVVLAVTVVHRELPATRSRGDRDDTGVTYPIAA